MNHVHEELDRYGYCVSCGERVMTHFKGFPLPNKPYCCSICGSDDRNEHDAEPHAQEGVW